QFKHLSITPSFQQITKWIKEKIKKKERCVFKKDQRCKKEVCICGFSKPETTDEVKGGDFTMDTRSKEKQVQTVPTDAFGDINFGGFWQKNSTYMRVSADTKPELLYELLTDKWKLSPPNLVVSVTGGAQHFYLKSHLRKIFHRGLIKVAQTTSAWIITGGTHAGVMRHVGQAVREYALSNTRRQKIVAIGVAPWGVIHNKAALVHDDGCFPAHYVIDTQGQGDLTCLDNNHTHFLLVDNGTNGEYGVEIELRTELEKYISGLAINLHPELGNKVSPIKIPVVCVVVNGGFGTLKTIHSAINKGIPCMILEGSGRLADVIANLHGKKTSTSFLIHQLMQKFFGQEYENFSTQQIVDWKLKIQEIMKKSDLLTIFRASKDDQKNMDVAILLALLKASKKTDESLGDESWKMRLELAIAWNRADLAKTEIFTEEKMWKSINLHWAMKLALVDNKPDFVSLLLENGVCLEDFLDEATLCELYQKLPNCFFLYKMLKRVDFSGRTRKQAVDREVLIQARKDISLNHVADEVRHLLGKFTKKIYRPAPKDGGHTMWIEDIPPVNSKIQPPTFLKGFKAETQREDDAKKVAGRDLFLWAVVQNNKEMAKIAWDQCRDCMSAALAASKILKKMANESLDADEPQEMLELASHYEDHAIGVFSECYKNNEERAQKLLVRISRLWGKTTCLRLALEADNKNFVSQSGVQDLLTQIWCGELSVNNPVWRVLVCMVFFPLIYTKFLAFRCDEDLQREIEQKEEIKMTVEEEKNSTWNNNSDCSKQSVEYPNCWSRLLGLYCAPQVKFYGNIVSYFAFLFLFAYVLMVDFQRTPSIAELVLYFWLFTLVCEEIRQLFYDPDHFGFCEKAKVYIQELWNILDVISILLFCLGLAFRLTTKLLYPGKIILCIDFVVFCLRLMAIFTINRTLGPKIIIVRKMMRDLFFFMFLLSIWVVAYGVAKQGILIENDNRLDWIMRGAIYEPYLVIFGNFPENIDNAKFDMNSCSMNGTDPMKPKCPVLNNKEMPAFPEWLTIVMLCVYLLFANILLINLLIAIFNYTFEEVHDNTDRIWKFQRYQLIKEYYSRPAPPPPFIILSHLYLFIRKLGRCDASARETEFKKDFRGKEEEEQLSWEALMRDTYMISERQAKSQSMEGCIQDSSQKVTTLTERLEKLEEQVTSALQRIEDSLKSLGAPAKETQPQSTVE
ncbi:PREDICTED: transient receptor potential cation channel subfamily M member 2-like, partial [Poecilia mexicana]|uniref:transient receptor potential cation channel subfamily M member 2-like n=1 Tax=Poecilia mexicana TaxID=48701 RepID=UPI00072DCD96